MRQATMFGRRTMMRLKSSRNAQMLCRGMKTGKNDDLGSKMPSVALTAILGCAVCEKVYMDVEIGEEKEGRLLIGLFSDMLPRTCENFRSLCEGFKTSDGKTISYRDTPFHRVIRGFMAQGGDVTEGNGTGGLSIYGEQFEDEKFQYAHVRGAISMANRGPGTNSSQFFICMSAAPHLNGKHVVFGRLLEGEEVLDRIESFGSSQGTPKQDIRIVDCGVL
eukprot:g2314.t1